MATSIADIEADARREDHQREGWRRWRRRIGLVVCVGLAIALVVWTNWMVQRYYILGDDSARGEKFREGLDSSVMLARHDSFVRSQCQIAAEALYGHGILSSREGDDYAPPSEKAFYVACSGSTLGGRGGGQGD